MNTYFEQIENDFRQSIREHQEIRELEQKLGYLPGESKKSREELMKELGERNKKDYQDKKDKEQFQIEAEEEANKLFPKDKRAREIFIKGYLASKEEKQNLVKKRFKFQIEVDVIVPENTTSIDALNKAMDTLSSKKSPLAKYCNKENCIGVELIST